MSIPLIILVVLSGVILIRCIRQINQYERGVLFFFGKFSGVLTPGLNLVVPIVHSLRIVDIRTKAVDVPNQDVITKDNISARINAVIYYKVSDPEKAILEVENVFAAVSQLAQTTMRNVVGELDLDQLLAERDEASAKIREVVRHVAESWGVSVEGVELKDIDLPEEMKRVIGKQAEAERERRSVVIKAEGEVQAAENLRRAAELLAQSPGALHLRTLSTINDVSSDQSNTIIFALPIEVLRAFERFGAQK